MSELVIAEKADLVAIADVIRTLADKTEDMSLGEMAAEVSNANVNKTDILSALTEKGVDTTGAGLSDIAALVAGISAGGGFEVITTTYIPAEDITLGTNATNNLIPHNAGFIPRAYIFYREGIEQVTASYIMGMGLKTATKNNGILFGSQYPSNANQGYFAYVLMQFNQSQSQAEFSSQYWNEQHVPLLSGRRTYGTTQHGILRAGVIYNLMLFSDWEV